MNQKKKNIDIKAILDRMDQLLDGKMEVYMNACVRCGLCADTCHYALANPDDPEMIPAYKINKISSLYRRYHTVLGKLVPFWTGSNTLTEEYAKKLMDIVFGRCTMCGRCGLNCSVGLHTGQIVRAARMALAEAGLVPESLQATVDNALRTGNNMAIAEKDFVDTIKWLEEDLQLELGNNTVKFPISHKDSNILYTLNPREPKFFPLSISAVGKIFHIAKESWTLSSTNYDVTNYALFSGNNSEARNIAHGLIEQAKKLNVNKLVMAECGHGFRSTRWEAANWIGEKLSVKIVSILELLAVYIKSGRIKLDPSKNQERTTLHDPCNLVRNGGVIEEQRYILKHAVTDFVEMTPNRTQNYCCGGGGGMLSMGKYSEQRKKSGKIKADQIKATGAKVVATPCHNCIDQLTELNLIYKLNVKIKTVSEIVADAIIMPTAK